MITMRGKSCYGGIARGVISFYRRDDVLINKMKVSDPGREWERYVMAKSAAVDELKEIHEKAAAEVGEGDAEIFYIHQLIVEDSQYEKQIKEAILERSCNAEYAVAKTAQDLAAMMRNAESDYIKERAADVLDVSERIIRQLQNREHNEFSLNEISIVCADDILPSETIMLDKSMVAAFCTKGGSTNSHTAILARTLNIPALIGMGDVRFDELEGRYAIVDGYDGILYVEPDDMTVRKLKQREDEEARKHDLLMRLKGRRNVTRDGKEFEVLANIGSLNDLNSAIENDAGGIGLLRTEFL